jgi:hypothetical protein
MARRILMGVLALGALGGFWSGFHHRHHDQREAFERHVADLCSDAALRANAKAIEKR